MMCNVYMRAQNSAVKKIKIFFTYPLYTRTKIVYNMWR